MILGSGQVEESEERDYFTFQGLKPFPSRPASPRRLHDWKKRDDGDKD
jgi:hypothetical protein